MIVVTIVLLDRAVVIADVPPVLDHGDDERSGQQYGQHGDVLVASGLRVFLLLEVTKTKVHLETKKTIVSCSVGGRGGGGWHTITKPSRIFYFLFYEKDVPGMTVG